MKIWDMRRRKSEDMELVKNRDRWPSEYIGHIQRRDQRGTVKIWDKYRVGTEEGQCRYCTCTEVGR